MIGYFEQREPHPQAILNAPTRPSVAGNVHLYMPPITFTHKRQARPNKFRIMTPMI